MKNSDYFKNSRTPSLDDLESNACYAAWMRFCQSGDAGYDLSLSNPTQSGLPSIIPNSETLLKAATAVYQASPQGLLEARTAIAKFYGGRTVPERIQLFASTSEAIGALLKLLCAPGDEVITSEPTYPLLDSLTSLESVKLRQIALQDCDETWAIDFWALENAVSERTRAILTVSPNNPTGHCIPRIEMCRLAEFCADRGIALIVDEVFASYIFHPDDSAFFVQPTAAHFNRGLIISLSGLSKVCGLPQHKLGWAVFGGQEELVCEAMQRLTFITDSTLSVSGWVQRMTPFFLANRAEFSAPCLRRLRRNYNYLCIVSQEASWSVDCIDGGWSVCIRLPGGTDDENVAEMLAENGIRVFPGAFFGYRPSRPTLNISLLPDPVLFNQGIALMADLLAKM